MTISKVALIGLGAMGAFFAPKLGQLLGEENFFVVAQGARKQRLQTQGVTLNGTNYRFNIKEPGSSAPVDLVIMAVKDTQLDQAIADIASFIGPQTQILCVMNGVDSEQRVAAVYGSDHVPYSYMRISIVMANGVADFNPDGGMIHFGEANNVLLSERVLAIQALFEQAQIRYRVDEDMVKGLWFKFMCNVSENLTCALLGIPFGAFQVSEHANAIRLAAMREVLAIAQSKGIDLSEADIERQEKTIQRIPFVNKPSTLQDLEQGKNTEIEMFAGQVLKMGQELGISTPISFVYYHGVKILEEKNRQCFEAPTR